MNSKLTDPSRFAASVKALFKSCNYKFDGSFASGTKASRACEKVYKLALRCQDRQLQRKLLLVSDALNEHRHLINASRANLLDLQVQHSRRVGEILKEAGINP